MNKIKSEDISVVIQGPIERKFTALAIKSVRKFLPKAEIILSTWKHSDVSGIECDVLLLNVDPGAEVYTPNGSMFNLNRQIVSTKNGLKVASRKYVLKIRSDIELRGANFLNYFDQYGKRDPKFSFLSKRILINSLFTRNSFYLKRRHGATFIKPYLFHPSDWVMFGLKEDLLNIWDIPLAAEPETSNYFIFHSNLKHDKGCLSRWYPEQYIWISFLKKNGFSFDFDNYYTFNETLAELSERTIINNTILLEYKSQFDILCHKYVYQIVDDQTMHHLSWEELYKKYCDPEFIISTKTILLDKIFFSPYRVKARCRFIKSLEPFILVIKLQWLKNLLSCIKYIFYYIIDILLFIVKLITSYKIIN